MAGLETELQSVLSREQYQGSYSAFITSLLPQCDQVIIECKVWTTLSTNLSLVTNNLRLGERLSRLG